MTVSLWRRFIIRDDGDVDDSGAAAATAAAAAAAVNGATGGADARAELKYMDAAASVVGSEALAAAACAHIKGACLLKILLVAGGSGHLGQRLL